MKKTYETPCADKIAFNYRDQVVAESGGSDPITGDNTGYNFITRGCDRENMIAFSYDVCSWING